MKFLRYLLVAFVFLAVAAGGAFYWARYQFTENSVVLKPSEIVIQKGDGVGVIANRLHAQKLISNPDIFRAAVAWTGNAGKLRSGEYLIPSGATQEKILNILLFDTPILHKITFPEGALSVEIRDALLKNDKLKGEAPTDLPEGSLKPETYLFARATDRSEIIHQMKDAQTKLLAELWEKRDPNLPLKTPEEALVLASIIEKETGTADERRKVASVFINRLRQGYRIQSDPTIIYGITKGQGKLNRPIYRTDILRATPYNTYVIDGLPPAPICNPGEAALRAALNPAQTDYLYFVADGTGGHAFAKNLQEHNANVAKWRKIEKSAAQKKSSSE